MLSAICFNLDQSKILFPNQALVFTYPRYKSFENTESKGEIAHFEQFLLFLQCFLTILRHFYHFHQNCRLQTLSVWKNLKFVVWERVKGEKMLKTKTYRVKGT